MMALAPGLVRALAASALPERISLLEHHGEGLSLLDSLARIYRAHR
ncbi:MAG: hypothetical protein R3F53_10470 [Gammaproteobacteria bacterium]